MTTSDQHLFTHIKKQLSISYNTRGRKVPNLHITFAGSQLQRDTICCSFSFCALDFESIVQYENAYSWLAYVQSISDVSRWIQANKRDAIKEHMNAPDRGASTWTLQSQ